MNKFAGSFLGVICIIFVMISGCSGSINTAEPPPPWSWPPDGCYDSYWYMHGGTPANPKKDNILIESDKITAFKNFINHVVNRVNTVTGATYKNDPHILGWEIINEPNMVSGIRDWFIEIGGYVKSVDPNHMVGAATGDLSWGPPGPNHFGDPGSFCIYTDAADICERLRDLAP
jgi:hypothetical protein